MKQFVFHGLFRQLLNSDPNDDSTTRPVADAEPDQAEACWLSGSEFAEWDAFVLQHPSATVYHLSGWRGFLEETFPHIKGDILALRDLKSGEIRAGIPLYDAKSFLFGRRLVSSPFATLGGPLVSSTGDLEQMLPIMLERSQRSGCRQIEIRGVRPSQLDGDGQFFVRSATNLHHFIDLPASPGELKRGFSQGVRRNISKAVNAGTEVVEDETAETLHAFERLHQGTRKRLGLPAFPAGFFKALHDHLPKSVVIVHVAIRSDNKKVLGGLLSLDFGDHVIYEHVGDTTEGRKLGVNHLLLWKSMERAVALGRRIYSLGRTLPDNAGLIQFKRAWGSVEEPLSTLLYPAESEGADAESRSGSSVGNRLARWTFRSLPSPIARIAGGYFYRHWA